MNWINPFNGSKTKVTRVISEGVYKRKVDPADYDLEDENEYNKLYVHKESGDGLLVTISNTLGAFFYVKRGVDNKTL